MELRRFRARHARGRASALLVVLAVASLGFVACEYMPGSDQGRTSGIGVDNRTAVELRFEIDLGGGRLRFGPIPPHTIGLLIAAGDIKSGRCTTEPLVAFSTADGREMARHEEPLCIDDVWIIEDSDLDPSAVLPESAPELVPS
jgi:hypothetical protein